MRIRIESGDALEVVVFNGDSRIGDLVIRLKRAYEKPAAEDGERILVDRLWPRGLTKQKARIDLWMKGIAPSTELRKWFGHDPSKWEEFQRRYTAELKEHADLIKELQQKARGATVTLIYAARDEVHNEAVVLKEFVERAARRAH